MPSAGPKPLSNELMAVEHREHRGVLGLGRAWPSYGRRRSARARRPRAPRGSAARARRASRATRGRATRPPSRAPRSGSSTAARSARSTCSQRIVASERGAANLERRRRSRWTLAAALAGPRVRRRERGVEQLAIVIREPPALHAAEQRREIAKVRAGAGAEIDDGERRRRRARAMCARSSATSARERAAASNGSRSASHSAEKPLTSARRGRRAPPRTSWPRVAHVGSDARAARALAASAARRAGSSMTHAERFRERAAVAGRDEHARVRGHGLGDRAGRRADDGQAERDGLRERHAVAFEIRGQHEHVGARVLALERLAVEIAEQAHALAQAQAVDLMLDRGDGRRVAQQAAGAREMPMPVANLVQRFEQHRVTLCAASACRRRAGSACRAARRACAARFRVRAAARLAPIDAGLDDAKLAIGTPSAASVRAVHWLVVTTRCTYFERAALQRADSARPRSGRGPSRARRDDARARRARGAAPRRRADDRAPAARGRR